MEPIRKEVRVVLPNDAEQMAKQSLFKQRSKTFEAKMRRELLEGIQDGNNEDELELIKGLNFSKEADHKARMYDLKKDKAKTFSRIKQEFKTREHARTDALDTKIESSALNPLNSYPSWPGNKSSPTAPIVLPKVESDFKTLTDIHVKFANSTRSIQANPCNVERNKEVGEPSLTVAKEGENLDVKKANHQGDNEERKPTKSLVETQKGSVKFPVRRSRDLSSHQYCPPQKRIKRGNCKGTAISRAEETLLKYQSTLMKSAEFMRNEANIFNVLVKVMCTGHPLLNQSNTHLNKSKLCTVESSKDGLHITLGEEVRHGSKIYLGVKVWKDQSKELAFWTRKTGEKKRSYLSN